MNKNKKLVKQLSTENQSSDHFQEEKNNLEPKKTNKKKLDPTRYGDWEVKGIAVDF